MARICFVSNEIYPVTPGGAGSLIYGLVQVLLAENHEVVLVLDIPERAFDQIMKGDFVSGDKASNCRFYHVGRLCQLIDCQRDDFLSRYAWESYRYDFACRQVYAQEDPDLIEFVDYCGPAYYALEAKISGLCYQNSIIAVRIHGSIEVIDRSTPQSKLNFDRYTIYTQEQCSLKLAEVVLYPTTSLIQEYYPIDSIYWLGDKVLAIPNVHLQLNRSGESPEANFVLFYGRLYSVKGIELFVDAAVRKLEIDKDCRLVFYLVGEDSRNPPVEGLSTYQEYLQQRIPEKWHNRFVFTGFLDNEALNRLLPKVKFAVLPSHYETFGFAAYELRMAGIPLILADIPAFKDGFKSDEVLFFDGTVQDLVHQMNRLDQDDNLRTRLSLAVQPVANHAGDFYRNIPREGWINSSPVGSQLRLLILIIDDGTKKLKLDRLLTSLADSYSDEEIRIVLLVEICHEKRTESDLFLFGKWYTCADQSGLLSVTDIHLLDALLVLKAGDEITPQYIKLGLDILSRHTQVVFVGSWKRIYRDEREWLFTHSLTSMVELAPFEILSPISRCIMRTPTGKKLQEIFNGKYHSLDEIAYLWNIDGPGTFGVEIPSPLIRQNYEKPEMIDDRALSHLILTNQNTARAKRLNYYLGMVCCSNSSGLKPLQYCWALKSGTYSRGSRRELDSMIIREGYKERFVNNLSHGGLLSRRLLLLLRWLRKNLNRVLHGTYKTPDS